MRILHIGYGFRPWRGGGLIAYAEDVMEAQAARGDEVTYFFRGRHYPGVPNDRLHRWRRAGVEMREVLNSTLNFGGDSGTLTPGADLAHGPSEAAFKRAVREHRPEVIHLQEIIGLPTSLIDIAIAEAIPIIATLQDYFPLCPVLKLYDVDDQLCHRREVGAQCARCSAHAPADRRMFVQMTVAYELRRRLGKRRGDQAVKAIGRLRRHNGETSSALAEPPAGPVEAHPARSASPAAYQGRRDLNLARLSRMDALVAQSNRVRDIYAGLGVEASRLRVIHLTLRHLQHLRPQRIEAIAGPLRFVCLNGIGSRQKGAEVIIGAVEALNDEGLADRFTLDLYGYSAPWAVDRLRGIGNVSVHGGYATAELDRLLDGYHAGIVPSVWEEPYAYVGVEFLAKGIPVIGNARGGIVDYTEGGTTGWVNPTADAAGLAKIIRMIISDPEQVPIRNRWILEHRSELIKPLDRHLGELDDLYTEVIAAR